MHTHWPANWCETIFVCMLILTVHVIIIFTHSAMNAVEIGFPFLWASSTVDRKLIIIINLHIIRCFYVHWIIIAAVTMPFISQGKPYSSPLGVACEKNHPHVALLLIKNGANINYKDDVCDNCHYCFHTFKEYFPHSMARHLFTTHPKKVTLKWWSYWCSLTPTWILKAMWVHNYLTSTIYSLYCKPGNVCC